MTSIVKYATVEADGVSIFYREAGPSEAPIVLLLHGFPSSSFQYRNLIPLLATKYHVIAPDTPGFGFTKVSADRGYDYTFASFATTIGAFLDVLNIKAFAVYIFDYGAPIALRLALQRPEAFKAIITQNGNAYVEGFGADAWAPIKAYWSSDSEADREKVQHVLLTFEFTKFQYEHGTPGDRLTQIAPEVYNLDWALMSSERQQKIQLDIFKDYKTNVALYPRFQEFFRQTKVPILVTWGKNDVIFVYAGAEAFKRDSPNVELHPLDAGHFAVETHTAEIAELILAFLKKYNY